MSFPSKLVIVIRWKTDQGNCYCGRYWHVEQP